MDSEKEILEMVKGSIEAGGAGVSIGRNVFQYKDPKVMVRAISCIINEGGSVEDGLKILDGSLAPLHPHEAIISKMT